ncbi:hypothetical protein [Nocardia carnea]|uniref:hypothetical protein n=1 Tax=Nocardia carnea TaxID=37328 RepID=UPI002457E0B8|nr:hypothetical protein [Nocardia carnea]
MTESRQQRRARERAEQKAATRPGPNLRLAPEVSEPDVGSVTVLEVDVEWNEDRDQPDQSFWSVAWAESDSDTEIREMVDTFEEVVEIIRSDLAQSFAGEVVRVEWTLDSDAEKERDRLGIELPAGHPLAD